MIAADRHEKHHRCQSVNYPFHGWDMRSLQEKEEAVVSTHQALGHGGFVWGRQVLLQGQHDAVCNNGGQDHVLKWSESVKELSWKAYTKVYRYANTLPPQYITIFNENHHHCVLCSMSFYWQLVCLVSHPCSLPPPRSCLLGVQHPGQLHLQPAAFMKHQGCKPAQRCHHEVHHVIIQLTALMYYSQSQPTVSQPEYKRLPVVTSRLVIIKTLCRTTSEMWLSEILFVSTDEPGCFDENC